MVLDTLPMMAEAQHLYQAFGFRDIPQYCENPIPAARRTRTNVKSQLSSARKRIRRPEDYFLPPASSVSSCANVSAA